MSDKKPGDVWATKGGKLCEKGLLRILEYDGVTRHPWSIRWLAAAQAQQLVNSFAELGVVADNFEKHWHVHGGAWAKPQSLRKEVGKGKLGCTRVLCYEHTGNESGVCDKCEGRDEERIEVAQPKDPEGDYPGGLCCQRATGKWCYEHDPANSKPRLCVECKWCGKPGSYHCPTDGHMNWQEYHCERPVAPCVVTGVPLAARDGCRNQRACVDDGFDGYCGPNGKHWEAK